jgi:hypothetical protein
MSFSLDLIKVRKAFGHDSTFFFEGMRRYSTIGYHAHCSVYSLRHKYRADRQQRKFPLFVEKKPSFDRKALVVESIVNVESELVTIPCTRPPRIVLERQRSSLPKIGILDALVWIANVARNGWTKQKRISKTAIHCG